MCGPVVEVYRYRVQDHRRVVAPAHVLRRNRQDGRMRVRIPRSP